MFTQIPYKAVTSSVEIQIKMDKDSYFVLTRDSVYNELLFQKFCLCLKEALLVCSCCIVNLESFLKIGITCAGLQISEIVSLEMELLVS